MNLVKHILDQTERRLAVLDRDASICDAAAILSSALTPLVVVCDRDGLAVGVVSGMDIVKVFGRDRAGAAQVTAAAIMSNPIHACGVDETVQSVWNVMTTNGLRSIPVLDPGGKPLGVAHASDIARALLNEVTTEELLLRDYVLGIGYQ